MPDAKTCGQCAAPDDCGELFQRLLALDFSMRAPWADVHAVSVACFSFQHSSSMARTGYYWAALHVYVEGGPAALGPMARRARRLNSHRHGGRAPGADDFPGVPPLPDDAVPPAAFATTIVDVAVDGSFPAEGHQERMRRWAADTVSAWRRAG
ncbi:DUF5946 family protein [Nonomuraea rhizosphaerae]|uniref:DUF5946 family protein n=1 Tax=Nonomuraea rhizosphaerae TaxID=2665663 RepID=UPI001C5F8A6D|nr:DUF5946 family protein [Nonomuraea rhizosphaerae]